jgi:hypothetical protein
MASTISVVEYKQDGFAIVEDSIGKYIVTAKSSDIIPLYDKEVQTWLGVNKTPCALLQSRESMMT